MGKPIKTRACAEFDRVVKAPESGVGNQTDQKRMKTLSAIAILKEKWAVVMAKDHAGYCILEWQELRDQVRHLIIQDPIQDPRYKSIQAERAAQ